jgi:hypothetical protein
MSYLSVFTHDGAPIASSSFEFNSPVACRRIRMSGAFLICIPSGVNFVITIISPDVLAFTVATSNTGRFFDVSAAACARLRVACSNPKIMGSETAAAAGGGHLLVLPASVVDSYAVD